MTTQLINKIDRIILSCSSECDNSDSKTNTKTSNPKVDVTSVKRVIISNSPFASIDTAAAFPALKNTALIDAAFGRKAPQRIPIWIHRQAGRYMPEFRAIRKKYSFFEICKTPELVCEVTLQPLNQFDFDAAIIFSDILVIIPVVFRDFNVQMIKGIGPVFDDCLLNYENEDKTKLKMETISAKLNSTVTANELQHELSYVYDGIRLTRHAIAGKVPLIGFIGGPMTLLFYAIEGQSSKKKQWSDAKRWLFQYADECRRILDVITSAIVLHLIAQANIGGAQVLEVFETLSCYLSGSAVFDSMIVPYLKRIYVQVRKEVSADIPIILFARGINQSSFAHLVHECGYEVYSLGWRQSASACRNIALDRCSLQGNLDPWVMFATDNQVIKQHVYQMLDEFETVKYQKNRLIVNLGHGMLPTMQPIAVEQFIQAVRDYEEEKFGSNPNNN